MKLGFIGLGIMGESMCENLVLKSGCEVYVYDIDVNQIDKLVSHGAIKTTSSSLVVKHADIIFSMVPTSKHVNIVFNEIKDELKDKIWVDMSTIEPSISLEISKKVLEFGGVMLDAPVVKSKAAAIAGALGIYVGGDEKIFEAVNKYLLMMGSNSIYMGENSKGLYMKIAHNMLVGQIQNGVNEMFVFAGQTGLTLSSVPTAISYGGGQNFYLDGKANAILNQDYTTAFSIENMAKDVVIANLIKDELNLDLKGFELVNDVYQEALSKGLAKEDFSATFKIKNKEV